MTENPIKIHKGDFSRDYLLAIINKATEVLSWYAVSLTEVLPYNKTSKLSLIGSGTLAIINDKYGIITAKHVVDRLKKNNDSYVGFCIEDEYHNPAIESKYLNATYLKTPAGLDLAYIILPDNIVATLKAKKNFYNISKHHDIAMSISFDEQQACVLCGSPDEFTKEETGEKSHYYTEAKAICSLTGFSVIEEYIQKEDHDFLRVSAIYKGQDLLPNSFGGLSGGGLWHFTLKNTEPDNIEISKPILIGVAFEETDKIDNRRDIICNGPISINSLVKSV